MVVETAIITKKMASVCHYCYCQLNSQGKVNCQFYSLKLTTPMQDGGGKQSDFHISSQLCLNFSPSMCVRFLFAEEGDSMSVFFKWQMVVHRIITKVHNADLFSKGNYNEKKLWLKNRHNRVGTGNSRNFENDTDLKMKTQVR